jgi:hypothetical protein
MSNKISIDLGLEIGNTDSQNDADLSYIKFKMGKGAEESMVLKQIIESGTGRTLKDDDHYVCVRVPADTDTTELKDVIEGLTAEDLIEEVEGQGGMKWLMVSLKKYNDESETVEDYEKMQKDITNFFNDVKAHSFVEFAVKTPHNFTAAKKIAEELNEKTTEEVNTEKFPSFMSFLNDASVHVKMDCDHDFAMQTAQFAKSLTP